MFEEDRITPGLRLDKLIQHHSYGKIRRKNVIFVSTCYENTGYAVLTTLSGDANELRVRA